MLPLCSHASPSGSPGSLAGQQRSRVVSPGLSGRVGPKPGTPWMAARPPLLGLVLVALLQLARPSPGLTRDDSPLAAAVKLGLTIHRVVPAHVIDVEVCKGPVAVPDSAYERLHAKSVISRLPAVGFSENKLDVRRSWALKTDGGIRRDIVTRLWSDRLIVARSIDVTVEDGVATLTGTVDTWTELLDAISKALDAGATKVRDRLKLEGAPRRYQR
jgi:hypothetical protein